MEGMVPVATSARPDKNPRAKGSGQPIRIRTLGSLANGRTVERGTGRPSWSAAMERAVEGRRACGMRQRIGKRVL